MKPSIFIATLVLATLPAMADDAADAYRRGVEALQTNDVDAASKAFNETLKLNPQHPYARYQLGRLKQAAPQMRAKKKEAELASVRLPEVRFEEAPLSDVLTALNAMIEAESTKTLGKDKAITPNLNVQDSTGKLGAKEISLQLKNVPANMVLQYALDQAGAKIRYDEYATVIVPAGQ
ncbi:hypothetical protein HNR46_001637 [Haloferula luteola]|uniref:Tetratricopeptide repeat protein n=1 Tax=Haloferula luteola TaxID=595692 RepID=A0A840VF08_9BACT|nr:hypothetical protein [Haloferula luteola]MBB5351401.1 hypothetical protein [Haloferula luteola]